MSGKTFKESTGESETGGQNEPLPDGQPPLGNEVSSPEQPPQE